MFSARTFLKATRPMARSFSAQPARQIAKITLVGRLPNDAELSQTSAGREYVRYAVGNTIKKANGEEKTSWFRVSAFGDRSKEYTLSLKKGTLVYVEGTVSTEIQTAEDGKTFTTFYIQQQNVQAIVRPKEQQEHQEE